MQRSNLSTPYVPGDRVFRPCATGTHFNGHGGGTEGSMLQVRCRQTRKLLRVIAAGTDNLQIEWANVWTSNTPQALDASCEKPGPNNVTVRMTVEAPAGNPRIVSGSAAYQAGTAYVLADQVTSGGDHWVCIQAGTGQTPADGSAYWRKARRYTVRWAGDTDSAGTVVFAPGAIKQSVPFPLAEPLRAGDMIAVLGAFDTGSATNKLPVATTGASNTAPAVDWVVDASGGMPAVGSSLPETGVTTQTNGNTTALNSTDEPAWMRIPWATAVCGTYPDPRCVAVWGDSLMLGGGDMDVVDGEFPGAMIRALEGVPRWRIAQGGNKAACYKIGNAPWQMSAVQRCSAVVTDMGVNDLQYGLTAAQVKTAMADQWQALAATGVPVYQCLLTPISTSSDAWATVANQGQWTVGGATQFPGGAQAYDTSQYGLAQMWLSQDGAAVTGADGVSVQAGQRGHPLQAVIDDRALMTDTDTGWKWLAGYTIDGAHPNTLACTVQAQYLRSILDLYVLHDGTPPHPYPGWNPSGEVPVASMPRSQAVALSATPTTGTIVSVIGVSDGRKIYGARWMNGSLVASARWWTLLAGLDPTKMKVVGSGTYTAVANALQAVFVTGYPIWIPAGYLIALCHTTPGANALVGSNAALAAMHKTPQGYVLGGAGTRSGAVMPGPVNLEDDTASTTRFAAHAFRAWAEIA